MMELYIIRHGETDWNVQKKLQGRSDTELNEYGIKLAEITSEALKDIDFDIIYSSPLKRAYTTAEIMKRDRDIPLIKDDRLIEMCFGIYEGAPASEVPANFKNFFDDPAHYTAPPQGETYEEVVARAQDFIDNVIVPASETMKRMMIVAHGALNRGIMISLNHEGIDKFWSGVFQRNCCVNIFEIDGNDYTMIENGKIFYEPETRGGFT